MGDLRAAMQQIVASTDGRVGYYLQDLRSGAIWEHDAVEPFPAASTIKLPIMVAAFQSQAAGSLDMAERVRVKPENQVGGSGVLTQLQAGAEVSVLDLITLMIIVSDNTATNLVIDRVGFDRINALCQAEGLSATLAQRKTIGNPFYERPDYSLAIDNQTSPRDQGQLYRLVLEGSRSDEAAGRLHLTRQACLQMMDILLRQQLNTRIPCLLPSSTRIAHKTGSSPLTAHDAGIIFRGDEPLFILAVLTEGVQDPQGYRPERAERNRVIASLARAAWDHLS